MSRRLLFLIIFSFLNIENSNAGLGGFLTVYNNTPYPITININNTSPDQPADIIAGHAFSSTAAWNDNPDCPSNYVLMPFTSYPSNGPQYIEANDAYEGASNGAITLNSTITPSCSGGPQYLNSTVSISEGGSAYSAGISGGNTPYFNVQTNISPGTQWTINVVISPLYPNYNAASWMSCNPNIQNSSLSQITVPGAHDAAMSNSGPCTFFANAANTQTQYDNFYTMLVNDGVRNFDCRPVIQDATLTNYLGHFTWGGEEGNSVNAVISTEIPGFLGDAITTVTNTALGPTGATLMNAPINNQGCVGMSLANALGQVKQFLTNTSLNNGHEVIVMDFSHFMDMYKYNAYNSNFDATDAVNFFKQVRDSLTGYLYSCTNCNIFTVPIKTITATGSKVIVLIDTSDITGSFADTVNGSTGFYAEQYMNSTSYSNVNDVPDMVNGQFANMTSVYPGLSYKLMSWTLTLNSTQAFLCVPGPTGVQVAEGVVMGAAGGGASVLLGPLAGIYANYTVGNAINAFNQSNPCVSVLNLAGQANNALGQISPKCAATKIFPNVIYGDAVSPALLNVIYTVNTLNGK